MDIYIVNNVHVILKCWRVITETNKNVCTACFTYFIFVRSNVGIKNVYRVLELYELKQNGSLYT